LGIIKIRINIDNFLRMLCYYIITDMVKRR